MRRAENEPTGRDCFHVWQNMKPTTLEPKKKLQQSNKSVLPHHNVAYCERNRTTFAKMHNMHKLRRMHKHT